MKHIADMIEAGCDLVITHSNGPQVGFISRRYKLSTHELYSVPLDYCGADSQGEIGYVFQWALFDEFQSRVMDIQTATVVIQVLVDCDNPVSKNSSKPIGSFMVEAKALECRERDGWSVVEDAGRG